MDHSGRLINLNLKAKATIDHEFDECFIFDYKSYGFDPYFKKYEGIKPLRWRFCNQDRVCEDILLRLGEKEPLFKKVSPEFKKWFFLTIVSDFENFYEKMDFYEDVPKVNWAIIYPHTRSFLSHRKDQLNDADTDLLAKSDIFFVHIVNEVERLVPNFYGKFNKDMRENDPILYKKLQEYNLDKNKKKAS